MIGTDVTRAAQLLREGQLVGIPTETVYGLAGNALHEATVLDIFSVKNRPAFDPLIVHVPSLEHLRTYVRNIPESARVLAQALMPGPLTLLLPKASIIPDLVTSGLDTVAVRIPRHPLTRQLLELLDFPLAAPSANPFGYISPTTAQHVAQQLGDKIPYILDGGPCEVGLESTIVGFEEEYPVVYRKGGVSIERIESLIGSVRVQEHSSSNPQAPGMLKSHYAPRTPLRLGLPSGIVPSSKVGIIAFRQEVVGWEHQEVLSASGSYTEAAQRLFAALRRLDALGLELIYAELLPEQDLGRAINDRLRRAAAAIS
jgi:L-threonylcarbamoyladenylate synthase